MINVLIPMAGKSLYFSETEYPFPKPLLEIGPRTVIEHVISNLSSIDAELQFIFVLNSADCRKFHLDSTLNIITDHKCKIIRLENETKGAACSALMAISHIANDKPLIIANSDQIFEGSLKDMVAGFRDSDAGVMTFESVHPDGLMCGSMKTNRSSKLLKNAPSAGMQLPVFTTSDMAGTSLIQP